MLQIQVVINRFMFLFILMDVDGRFCNQSHPFLYRDFCLTLHFEPVSWPVAFINCKKQAKKFGHDEDYQSYHRYQFKDKIYLSRRC